MVVSNRSVTEPVFNYISVGGPSIGLVFPQHHVDRCLAEEIRRGLSGPPENDGRLAELQPNTERHEGQHQQHCSKHALAPNQPGSGSTEDRHVQRDVLRPDTAGVWSVVEPVNECDSYQILWIFSVLDQRFSLITLLKEHVSSPDDEPADATGQHYDFHG